MIKAQGELVRKLKAGGASSNDEVTAAVNLLLALKAKLAAPAPAAGAAAPSDGEKKKLESIAKQEAAKQAAREKKKAAKAAKRGEGCVKAGGETSSAPPPAQAPAAAATPSVPAPGKGVVADMIVCSHVATPPVLAFIASKLSQLTVHFQSKATPGVLCYLPHGAGEIHGDKQIARYFARLSPVARGVYGAPPPPVLAPVAAGSYVPSAASRTFAQSQTSVDEWVDDKADALRSGDAKTLEALNARLAMRTFVAHHEPSLADAAAFAAVSANKVWAGVRGATTASKLPHLARWFASLYAMPAFQQADEKYLGGARKGGSFAIELPGAEKGKVRMRFAPEPSGYMHIGHAKAALLSDYFAKEYEGELILRFDDTNPSNEKEEYEDSIVADVHRLGLRPVKVTHTSDYFDLLVKAQTEMIERGDAFVDPSPAEDQQKLRFARIPSPYRDQSVAENLRLWAEMQKATELGQQCCVRAKMDPGSDNGTLRDPTTFRVNLKPHHVTGECYKVYPTYDFACPWTDAHEGITHALRDRQYHDRDAQYHRMAELQRVRKTELWSFSRINFKQCLLSKRKLNWFVNVGRVDGWTDPRMPTMRGILRRGLSVEGLRTFILLQGASQNTNLMEWDKIWAENRKIIDASAPRYTAITKANAVPFVLSAADASELPAQPQARPVLKHKKAPELGSKLKWYGSEVLIEQADAVLIADGEEVTLMDWGNAVVDRVHRDASGAVLRLEGRLHLAGNVKTTKWKLTWACAAAENVAVQLVDLDHLITKDHLEDEDKMDENAPWINQCTKEAHDAIGEPALRLLPKGETIQIERRGFYICDAPYIRPADPIVLYFVPDGKHMYGYRKPAPKADASSA